VWWLFLILANLPIPAYAGAMTIEQTVEIPADRRLIIDVPPEVPVGPVILTFTPKEPEGRGFGCLKGQIWMADDFDAPLEDFKDYR
jgi:hypothetical protein